jgi:MFS family permease
VTDERHSAVSGLRKVVVASMAGTVVEWYEFFLYGTAATLVFNKVFFAKGTSDLDAILAAFVTYAVGFAARPLGGVVFGHFGDKYGRKKLLQFSILLVGAATFLMGCLPTFAQIGYWAPALLVVLRFIQDSRSAANGAVRCCWWPSTARTRNADSGPAGPRPAYRWATCSPPSFCSR